MDTIYSRINEGRLVVDGGEFEDQELKSPRIDELVIANGAQLANVRFHDVRIKHGSFGAGRAAVTYTGCQFENCRLAITTVGRANFINCSFAGSYIKGWFALSAEFLQCSFSSELKHVVFDARPSPQVKLDLRRTKNRYENNDFTASSFVDVSFRGGIELKREFLPKSPGGFFLPEARAAYSSMADKVRTLRDPWAVDLLAFLEVRLDACLEGQEQDYVSPADIGRTTKSADGQQVLQNLFTEVAEQLS
ncbi:hypothetical protein ACFW0V_22870 [Micromonospora parva]|uniref:hypothetical protein n=1 Tax=Micromonospora parva TaxID=1464048 RepID=UPI00367040B9